MWVWVFFARSWIMGWGHFYRLHDMLPKVGQKERDKKEKSLYASIRIQSRKTFLFSFCDTNLFTPIENKGKLIRQLNVN